MKRRQPARRTTLTTGEHCHQSGWWAYDDDATPRFIAEGSVMPAIGGRPTRWWFVLVGRQPMPS
jgi:hypothetical protein